METWLFLRGGNIFQVVASKRRNLVHLRSIKSFHRLPKRTPAPPQVSLSPQATLCVECMDIRKHVATLTRDIKEKKRRKRIKASKYAKTT